MNINKISIVISQLISLMNKQSFNLKHKQINSICLNYETSVKIILLLYNVVLYPDIMVVGFIILFQIII